MYYVRFFQVPHNTLKYELTNSTDKFFIDNNGNIFLKASLNGGPENEFNVGFLKVQQFANNVSLIYPYPTYPEYSYLSGCIFTENDSLIRKFSYPDLIVGLMHYK